MSAATKAAEKWRQMPMLAFDLETSGINPIEDRIVTAALIELRPGARPAVTSYVVDPGVEIPAEAEAVHGYNRDRARREATHEDPGQAMFEIAGRLAVAMGRGVPVIGFNLAYDLTLFEAECTRNRIDGLVARLGRGRIQPVIDVHVLDKELWRRKGSRKLTDTCATYGVRHTGAHDAGGDALASARVFQRMVERFPATFTESLTLGVLHQRQVEWRRKQMNGLRGYFDSKQIEHDGCDGGWPLYDRLTAGAGAVA